MAWSEEHRNNESDAGALIRRGTQAQAHGNLEEAESLFRDAELLLVSALERADTDPGTQDDELPILLRELSRLYILQSAHQRAEGPLLRLLTITKAQGENRPEATVLASLAAVRYSLGDYASAEHLYRQALDIRQSLAPNHVNTAGTMESLAETCAARGNFAEAISLCNRALSIRELTLDANDPSLRVARQRIADMQLEAQEEKRISTPTRSVPAQGSSSRSDESPMESRPSGGASRMPAVLVPWADELAFVRDEIEATSPAVAEDRAPRRSLRTTATGARSSAAIAGGAAVVVLLVALGFKQFANKPDRNSFAEAEPYNPASRLAVQPVAPPAVSTLASPARTDTVAVASTKDEVGRVSPPLDSRATVPNVVARDVPRSRAPARSAALAGARAVNSPAPAPAPARAPTITDSIPARATPPAVEKAPEARARDMVNAPTSPILIGIAPQPQYPEALRDQQVEGEVVVQFVVDETGRPDVSSMTVVRSPHVLLTNAVRAVLTQFRYEPARTAPPQSSPRPETVRYAFTFRPPRK